MSPPPAGITTISGALPGPAAATPLRRRVAAAAPVLRPSAAARAGLLPWVPVLLAAGIALWFALPAPPSRTEWAGLGAVALIGLALARAARRRAEAGRLGWAASDAARLGGLALLLIAAGVVLAGWRAQNVAAPVLGFRYYGPVEGRVVEIDRSARDRLRITLDQVRLGDMRPARRPARVRLSLMDMAADSRPQAGQRVMTTGHLGPPPGPAAPGSFDFRQYAWFQRLGAVGYTRAPILHAAPPPRGGVWAIDRWRMALAQAMRNRIGGQQGAVAAALMTGDRSGITEATNEVMRASNLYHIISISGLHMGMLAGFVYAALRLGFAGLRGAGARLRWPAHKLAAGAAIVAAAAYLWLSGGGVATERAFIMVAVMLVAIIADRRAISLRTVAVAATVILAWRPESLISPGFQLSFAATVALILTLGPWARLAPRLPWWLRPVLMLVVSSFVAGMATAPIAAAHFSRAAHYGLLANLLAVPVMGTLVMPAGVIAALLAPVGLAGPALWVMGLGTGWILTVARHIAALEGAVSAIPLPPAPTLPLILFGATLMVLGWRRDRMRSIGAPLASAATGATLIASSFTLWLTAQRPDLLIAPEGEAVGLMTPQGRAVSKPKGGAFVIGNWLLEDGDIAPQAESAARPGWQGDKRDRQAKLPNGWHILHFTGKGAGKRAAPECQPNRIIIATEPLSPRPARPDCLLFDLTTLRNTGAVALSFPNDIPRITTVTQTTGHKPWARSN